MSDQSHGSTEKAKSELRLRGAHATLRTDQIPPRLFFIVLGLQLINLQEPLEATSLGQGLAMME